MALYVLGAIIKHAKKTLDYVSCVTEHFYARNNSEVKMNRWMDAIKPLSQNIQKALYQTSSLDCE